MGPLAGTLAAISMGAVYMGALTYIGNAPNFMVYAIARGARHPHAELLRLLRCGRRWCWCRCSCCSPAADRADPQY